MSLALDYSSNWKDLGNILMYQTMDFQFLSSIIITDFEGCLTNKISNAKLYHTINNKNNTPTIKNIDFMKRLTSDAKDASIVILSNHICNSKLAVDSLKRKFDAFMEMHKLPMLALFALKPDRFSKPHSGMWKLLNSYYKSNKNTITKAKLVSDFGGRIITTERRNGKIITNYDRTDTDRAFSHNIGVEYNTIVEYLDSSKKEKFNWNTKCLSPEIRELYIKKLSEYKNPNIFAKLAELGQSETYMLMVYGAPRSGKTTLAKELVRKWRDSDYGKSHVIKRFDRHAYTKTTRINHAKKALLDRISVIIDGDCHTEALRAPFLEMAKETKTPVLHIEVNPGIGMAYIFNHVAVEEAKDNVYLYPDREYYSYKSVVSRPPNTVLYCPVIKETPIIMEYRF